jgi:hypothetical protein
LVLQALEPMVLQEVLPTVRVDRAAPCPPHVVDIPTTQAPACLTARRCPCLPV